MNPTSEEIETYFQTEKEFQLFRELEEVNHDLTMAEIRIEELEAKNKNLENLQDAWEYVNMPKEIPISYSTLLTKVRDLETQNKILIETGHWIGQDEAHDLKVAVEEFLGYARTGRINDDGGAIFNVPDWQMEELTNALNDCGQFKDYSLDSPSQFFLDEAEKLIEKIKTDFFNTAPK